MRAVMVRSRRILCQVSLCSAHDPLSCPSLCISWAFPPLLGPLLSIQASGMVLEKRGASQPGPMALSEAPAPHTGGALGVIVSDLSSPSWGKEARRT